jgi:hypothetical protein
MGPRASLRLSPLHRVVSNYPLARTQIESWVTTPQLATKPLDLSWKVEYRLIPIALVRYQHCVWAERTTARVMPIKIKRCV